MKKFTKNLRSLLLAASGLVLCAFSLEGLLNEDAVYVQKKLSDHYDVAAQGADIKRYELNVTNTGFCRYKRHFANGKVEYFSFNFSKFKDLDYYGTVKNGRLFLRTKGEDVIVQTYNDKKGDIDSMSSYLSIPLRDMEPEDLTDFLEKFRRINVQLAAR
ncbi:hypothetical protein [Pedobacter nutrimenti]|uniref:Uncharacterized protein n=1 Tax=Pedobacter nutrimenti TaxID=1241337 RepID=A0A318UA34_9SPHI|nr:hypothetical protein [Pedobacter nutrimenti]PYF72443.1 hypothetical protein B0O44_10692 [Pedobacter nutrimenti]